jgi:hypothetical protein
MPLREYDLARHQLLEIVWEGVFIQAMLDSSIRQFRSLNMGTTEIVRL